MAELSDWCGDLANDGSKLRAMHLSPSNVRIEFQNSRTCSGVVSQSTTDTSGPSIEDARKKLHLCAEKISMQGNMIDLMEVIRSDGFESPVTDLLDISIRCAHNHATDCDVEKLQALRSRYTVLAREIAVAVQGMMI